MPRGKPATIKPPRPKLPKFLVFDRVTGESTVFEGAGDVTLFLWGKVFTDFRITLVLEVKPEERELGALERELNQLYRTRSERVKRGE